LSLWAAGLALANGGPFVIKYPSGDPSAKGILARLDPSLKPQRETRLRVLKEDLNIAFLREPFAAVAPLAAVSAEYTIENPTAEQIEVDLGFPILRGILMDPTSMAPRPDVRVRLNEQGLPCTIITNSAIYGLIRQQAREVIDKAVAADAALAKLVAAARDSSGDSREKARGELASRLTRRMRWNPRDAALLVEYASLDFSKEKPPAVAAPAGWWFSSGNEDLMRFARANLGPLAAIGEQKATQLFAQLASRFDPKAAASYEAIFEAWGGDVRERSVDVKSGKVRPREMTADREALNRGGPEVKADAVLLARDPTVYARVDYLDRDPNLTETERAACRAILKNLPVVFTFAPMNLLHYQVKFPAKSTQTLTVTYSQYPYLDTRQPSTYQLAYVVHPASLWRSFGPIHLEVALPEGIPLRTSAKCEKVRAEDRPARAASMVHNPERSRFAVYRGVLRKKTGELFLAIDADAWKKNEPKVATGTPGPAPRAELKPAAAPASKVG
jgi:hypothetical protein